MQTSRECVLRAIEMRCPDRVPLWLSFSRDPLNNEIVKNIAEEYKSDILLVGCRLVDFKSIGPGYHPLGYKRVSFGETMGEVLDSPLADFSNFERWKAALPSYANPHCYDQVRGIRKTDSDIFIVGALNMMMEELIDLFGYENYMISLYEEEERVNAVIDILYDLAYQMVDGYADAGADAVIAWEDWGLQNSPLMSYEMWKKYFRRKMHAFVDYIHAKGMKYILHSCGHITYLMDSFAEMGIDALQLDQQMNMGLDVLEKWKGKFCFCCSTDIQHCVEMSDEEMSDYLVQVNARLSTPNGGYIFKPYPQPAAIHMTEEKLRYEIKIAEKLKIHE